MVALFLGQLPYAIYERQGLLEVGETEDSSDMVLIDHRPMRPVRQLFMYFSQFLALKWGDATAAGNTGFSSKVGHGSTPSGQRLEGDVFVADWRRPNGSRLRFRSALVEIVVAGGSS